jgi:hypothetical protein
VQRDKTWATVDPELEFREVITFIQPGEARANLGVNINPWNQKSEFDAGRRLLAAARNCARAHLKPTQKIVLLTEYIVPTYLYVLVEDLPSRTYLNVIRHIQSTVSAAAYDEERDHPP